MAEVGKEQIASSYLSIVHFIGKDNSDRLVMIPNLEEWLICPQCGSDDVDYETHVNEYLGGGTERDHHIICNNCGNRVG